MLNALLIGRVGLSPLIATLGTLTLYRGLALHLTGAALTAVSGPILWFARAQVCGRRPAGAGRRRCRAGAAPWRWPGRSPGRQLLALGGSPRSAAGDRHPIQRLLLLVYGLAGCCGAAAGLIVVGRVGVINSDLGFGFEFTVITAVVLGGTSLFGGRAAILGSVMGALLLTIIDNGLNLIGANPYAYDVVRGLILVGAVSLDAAVRSWRDRAGGDGVRPEAARGSGRSAASDAIGDQRRPAGSRHNREACKHVESCRSERGWRLRCCCWAPRRGARPRTSRSASRSTRSSRSAWRSRRRSRTRSPRPG